MRPDGFAALVRKTIKARDLSIVRVCLDINENPVQVYQLLSGKRPQVRIREKLCRYLGIAP
jgi:predicted DNA-binding transcriptional regulator